MEQVRNALPHFPNGKGKDRRDNGINALSVPPTVPPLCNYRFMGEIFSNNFYSIFSFGPMHRLFLQISKVLKDYKLESLHELDPFKALFFQV